MIAELVISLLLVIAGVFGLIGSIGLLKLRQPMQRLHAPTAAELEGELAEIPAEWPTAVQAEVRALVAGMLESIVAAPRGKGRPGSG